MTSSKVMVGLSGGVDSSLSCALLLEQGYEVEAVFMKNWEEDDNSEFCAAAQDALDAQSVCDRLNIPFYRVNFAAEYWDKVFSECLKDFEQGFTPNPDIFCNREIKFSALWEFARNQGAKFLATGHYAKIIHDHTAHLYKAADPEKDQTYFLYALNQEQLHDVIFPLGNFNKTEVRKLAKSLNIPTAEKKDSTGICFIGEKRFKPFLQRFLPAQPGDIIDVQGKKIGEHEGIVFYTLGQRQGLQVGGVKGSDQLPWYIVDKITATNELVAAQGVDHPRLFSQHLTAKNVNFIQGTPLKSEFSCQAKIRYRQKDEPCEVKVLDNGKIEVKFQRPQRAVTPGQSIVLYLQDECLGGGIIEQKEML